MELREAATYYEREADGLGEQFLREAERVVTLLAEHPGVGAPARGELRRWPLRRFPYYVIYRAERGALLVLAVAHERRRPGYWEGRR